MIDLGCHIFITDPDDVCGVEEDNGVLLSRTWMACGKERKTMVSRPTNKAKDPRVGAGGREIPQYSRLPYAIGSKAKLPLACAFNSFPIHTTGSLHLYIHLYFTSEFRHVYFTPAGRWALTHLCRPPMTAVEVVFRLGYGHRLTATSSDDVSPTGLTHLQVQEKCSSDWIFFLKS